MFSPLSPVLAYFYSMKNQGIGAAFCCLLLAAACKSKDREPAKNFISVVSLIRKDVAHVDTSLYSIVREDYSDSLRRDTSYIPREEFAAAAADFLALPDLSDKKVASRYREEPVIHDEMLNRVIISYVPVNPDAEEYKKQELLATPVPGGEAKINNIIIVREISNRDSFFQQKMLWQVNKSFQVVTTRQKPGQPETRRTTKVSWNENP